MPSRHRLLTTIALSRAGRRTYALEGSIFVAGAAVQWLRDGLGLIGQAAEAGPLAALSDPGQQVMLVPAFVGLGAPYWDPAAQGILTGLTRNTGPAELARAALECVAFQTADLMDAMHLDAGERTAVLRVDGGMSASDWTMQCVADMLDRPVERPPVLETTALGAAYLAGLDAGLCPEPPEFARFWQAERRFVPQGDAEGRARRRARVGGCGAAVAGGVTGGVGIVIASRRRGDVGVALQGPSSLLCAAPGSPRCARDDGGGFWRAPTSCPRAPGRRR